MREPLIILIAVGALLTGACADDTGAGTDGATRTEATTPSPELAAPSPTDRAAVPTSDATTDVSELTFATCEMEAFEIGYPGDWWTNPGDEAPPCRVFHPRPVEVEGESLHYAVQAYVDEVEFDRATQEDERSETLSRQETTVDGQDAIVSETRSTGETLAPEGTLRYAYVVDLDGRILVLSTHSVGETDYERDKDILDRMVETVELPASG